eukprot:scpid66137/ scgid10341/ 
MEGAEQGVDDGDDLFLDYDDDDCDELNKKRNEENSDEDDDNVEDLDDSEKCFKLVLLGKWPELMEVLKSSENASDLVQLVDDRGIHIQCFAAMLGRTKCLNVLLESGADRDVAFSKHGLRLQHLAAAWGREDCLASLLEQGCDEFLMSSSGTTTFMQAVRNQQASTTQLLLMRHMTSSMKELIVAVKARLDDKKLVAECGMKGPEVSKLSTTCNKRADQLKSTKQKVPATWEEVNEQYLDLLETVAPTVRRLQEAGYDVAHFTEPEEFTAASTRERYVNLCRSLELIDEKTAKIILAR